MAKEGSVIAGLMDSFATAISLALQHGVPLHVLIEKFKGTRFEPSGFTGNQEIPIATSIMDYLFRYLASKFVKQDAPVVEAAAAPAPDEIQRVAEVVAAAQKIEVVEDRRSTPRNGGSGHKNGGSTHTGNGNYSFIARTDAPTCPECGSIMIPNGSCHKCVNCGTTSGCS